MRSLPSRHCLFLSTPSARRATRRYIRRRACCRDFYPRPPRGGRQGGCAYELCHLWISIHALREEGDSTAGIMCRRPTNFYPRPPRGGRQTYLGHFMVLTNFYPRPPRGGRPIKCKGVFQMTVISIHALREEGDRRRPRQRPVGRISIHALREEGDQGDQLADPVVQDFYPRPPRGGRPDGPKTGMMAKYFYPRPPRGGRPLPPRWICWAM